MIFKRAFLITLLGVFFLGAGFTAGYLFRGGMVIAGQSWPVLSEVFDILESQGLKAMPSKKQAEYGMIRGLIQAYDDPYTIFVEPPQHELEGNVLQGSFGGIGARLGKDPDSYWVLYPFPSGPAAKAGVIDGDRLLAAGDLQIGADTPKDTVEAALRGRVGEKVKVTISRRPDYAARELVIPLAEFPLPSVTWHLDAGERRLGVLEVNIIAASTPDEIQKAVRDLQSQGATAFALDLRNNSGGLLAAGIDTARLFLRDGVAIQQQYKGKGVETYRVEHPGPLADLPLVIFVNKNTASSAEIIAGILKAQRRAKIIGSPSFGKDTVQLVYDLEDGSSLHVTAAHWWVPGLEPPLAGHGVLPDVAVNLEEKGPDPAAKAADSILFPDSIK